MTAESLAAKHGFKVLAMPDPDRTVKGCYIGDLLSWVMGRARQDNAWITIMSNINIAAVAALSDVSLVILAEDVQPDENVLNTAKAKNVNIVCSPLPAYETAVRITSDV
ncbi:MAG: hypothetical protein IJC45_03115 [Clostridia bacterium]|nr:hypothetical protein [Clostridia bacterium]